MLDFDDSPACKAREVGVAILGYEVPFLVGGSYVVDPAKANDIDLLVHERDYNALDVHQELNNKLFRTLSEGDEKYDEIDHVRLVQVYERKSEKLKVNVIIVGTAYWPAYERAVNEMKSNPSSYDTRDKRIALHKGLCKMIKEIVDGPLPSF